MKRNILTLVVFVCCICGLITSIYSSKCLDDGEHGYKHECVNIQTSGPTADYCRVVTAYGCISTCVMCNNIMYSDHVLGKEDHIFVNISNNPTGVQIHKCTKCGFIKYV